MVKHIQKTSVGIVSVLLCLLVLALVPLFLGVTTPDSNGTKCLPSTSLPDPDGPDLDCPAPPNTFDVSSFFASNASLSAMQQAGPTWDAWAWASFAAMNWPAQVDTTQPTGYLRGVPSGTSTFKSARSFDVTVWETFKEKRELFNATVDERSAWQDITFDPAQQPKALGGSLPMCPGADSSLHAQVISRGGHFRLFSQGAKAASVAGDNTFDETVEVASQALESAATLCAGFSDSSKPTLRECTTNIFPDTSTEAVNSRTPVGPRVWKGDPGRDPESARPVYFEVKVNYDFWAYILGNGFFNDSTAFAAARGVDRSDFGRALPPQAIRRAHPKLPFRTSTAQGPGRSPNAKFAYRADTVAHAYETLSTLGSKLSPENLPAIGSVQVKVAWLLLDPAVEDTSTYHTTRGIYYKTDASLPGSTCYDVGHFGLLGIHIIQRVHAGKENLENSLFAHGGTFVFATWEHTGLGNVNDSTGYFYANFLAKKPPVDSIDIEATPFPNIVAGRSAIPVIRQRPYPLETTAAVNKAVHQALGCPGSVWCNYRLIGTQFVPVDSVTSAKYNQPYFLANLLVETNDGLQNFRGLPPGVTVTPYYVDKVTIKSTSSQFEPDYANVIFNRELRPPANMGGCMGCHGVAQLNGYNFSFVFQDGQRGSGLDTQLHFEVAGAVRLRPDTSTSQQP